MQGWKLEPEYAALAENFGSLETVFVLTGETLASDPLTEVVRVNRGSCTRMRRYLGKPRLSTADKQRRRHVLRFSEGRE